MSEVGPRVIPDSVKGSRLATMQQVQEISNVAKENDWARLGSQFIEDRLDPVDRHCILAFYANGVELNATPSCRCYLWFKERAVGRRTLVQIDVSEQQLQELPRIQGPHLERLVLMLIEELPLASLANPVDRQ